MTAHDDSHGARLHEYLHGEAPPERADLVDQVLGCEDCLAELCRLAEDQAALAGALGPGAALAPSRLEDLLDEVMAWAAIRDDSGAGGSSGAPVPTAAHKRSE